MKFTFANIQIISMRLFLVVFLNVLLFLPIDFNDAFGQILLPEQPRQNIPPPSNSNEQLERLKARRKLREDKVNAENPPPPMGAKKRDEELEKQVYIDRQLNFLIQTSLQIPFVNVSGSRSNYTTEPTIHLQIIFPSEKQKGEWGLWWGFRMASFSGTGIHNKLSGRYNFNYIGPSIGFGKLNPIPILTQDQKKENEPHFETRSGWMLLGGISALARYSYFDVPQEQEIKGNDFQTYKGILFDAPGIWAEFTYHQIHYGAVDIGYNIGTQVGKEKLFYWLGVTIGGWG